MKGLLLDEFLGVVDRGGLYVEEVEAVVQLLQVEVGEALHVLRLIDPLSEAVEDREDTGFLRKVDLELAVVRVGIQGRLGGGCLHLGDGGGADETALLLDVATEPI